MPSEMPRYWRNESGVNHVVHDWQESDNPNFEFVVTTECGLEYHTQSAGFAWDPSKPAYENTTYPDHDARCGNCNWDALEGAE